VRACVRAVRAVRALLMRRTEVPSFVRAREKSRREKCAHIAAGEWMDGLMMSCAPSLTR